MDSMLPKYCDDIVEIESSDFCKCGLCIVTSTPSDFSTTIIRFCRFRTRVRTNIIEHSEIKHKTTMVTSKIG